MNIFHIFLIDFDINQSIPNKVGLDNSSISAYVYSQCLLLNSHLLQVKHGVSN